MPKATKTEREPTGFQLAKDAEAELAAFTTEAVAQASAWVSGYGKLKAFAEAVALQLFGIRQLYRDTKTGNVDWYGRSNAYQTHVSEHIIAPVFPGRPTGDPGALSEWRKESGYGSFATSVSRAMDVLLANAQADGTMPKAEAKSSDPKDRRTPLRKVADDILDLAKNTGRSEAPSVTDVLTHALFFVRTAANVMTADDYKLSAPTKVRGLENQLQLELDRINAVLKAAPVKAKAAKTEAQNNRSGRTGRKAAA